MTSMVNVRSATGLSDVQLWEALSRMGVSSDDLPDVDGFVSGSVYAFVSSGYDLWGRLAIRDKFWESMEKLAGRQYTKRRINQFIQNGAEMFVISQYGVVKTQVDSLQAFAEIKWKSVQRGNKRKGLNLPQFTEVSGGDLTW